MLPIPDRVDSVEFMCVESILVHRSVKWSCSLEWRSHWSVLSRLTSRLSPSIYFRLFPSGVTTASRLSPASSQTSCQFHPQNCPLHGPSQTYSRAGGQANSAAGHAQQTKDQQKHPERTSTFSLQADGSSCLFMVCELSVNVVHLCVGCLVAEVVGAAPTPTRLHHLPGAKSKSEFWCGTDAEWAIISISKSS